MTTRFIGIKKFRENVTSLWKEAREKKIRYIVMYHSEPIFEVNPIDAGVEFVHPDEEKWLLQFKDEVKEAREQAKRGEVYSTEEVRKILKLKD